MVTSELAERLRGGVERVIAGNERTSFAFLDRAASANGHILIEGVPGNGEDALRAHVRGAARRAVPAHPVHARPDARRRRRHDRLQSADGASSRCGAARSSRTCCSPTRSIARRRKRKSALLEAMEERQVTIDGESQAAAGALHRVRHAESRSSSRAPIRCPKRNSTASSCARAPRIRAKPRSARCSRAAPPASTRAISRGAGVDAVASAEDVLAAQRDVRAVYVSEALQGYVYAIVARDARVERSRARREPARGARAARRGASGGGDRRPRVRDARRREGRRAARARRTASSCGPRPKSRA